MHTPTLEQSLNTEEMTFLERASSLSLRYLRKLLRWRADRGVIARGLLYGVNRMIDGIINTAEIAVGA